MQTINLTPAESLLQRLLQSEKLMNTYSLSLEKKEGHTCLNIHLSTPDPFPFYSKTHEKDQDCSLR